MAERRMFAKAIIDSDAFLDMPLSTQALYFHLSMRADDEGFVGNPRKILRMIGASDDDCKILIMKRFILTFDSGIIVIKHWKIHNYIQSDRFKETTYLEERETLTIDAKNSYTEKKDILDVSENKCKKELSNARKKRLEARKESELPYSFDYKIRQAFLGEECPICHCTMSYANNLTKPTIQHNNPISMGGKHEIDNISVICASCNNSIQNRMTTPPYNTEKVKEIWESIGNGVGMDTQVSIGKVSIVKDSIGESVITHAQDDFGNQTGGKEVEKIPPYSEKATTVKNGKFIKPTVEEVQAYCAERKNNVDAQRFVDYYTSNGWKVGKNPMKDWKASVRTWERGSNGTQNEGRPVGFDPDDFFQAAVNRKLE